MEHSVGIDVSLELSSLCVLDAAGKVVRGPDLEDEHQRMTPRSVLRSVKALQGPAVGGAELTSLPDPGAAIPLVGKFAAAAVVRLAASPRQGKPRRPRGVVVVVHYRAEVVAG